MSFSARDKRILGEISDEISAADPRLARALATGQLRRGRGAWLAPAVIGTCVLTGIALLTAGLVLGIVALFCVGAVLVQFGPAACAYLYRRSRPLFLVFLVGEPGAGAEQPQFCADRGLAVKRPCVTAGE